MPIDISGLSSTQLTQLKTLSSQIDQLISKLHDSPTARPEQVEKWINDVLAPPGGWADGKGVSLPPGDRVASAEGADALRLLQMQIQALSARQAGSTPATAEQLNNWIEQSVSADVDQAKDPATRETIEAYLAHVDAFGAAAFGGGSLDKILDGYDDKAVVMVSPSPENPSGVLHGKAEIRKFFEGIINEFRQAGTEFKMEGLPSFDNKVARFSWSAKTVDHDFPRATDTLVIKDGKIVSQTFSALVQAKGAAGPAPAKPEGAGQGLAQTPHGEDLRRHSTSFRNANLEAVVNDFAPDAVILTPGGVIRGTDEIRAFFKQVFANPAQGFTVKSATTSNDVGFIEWSAKGWPWGTDTFVYDGDKIRFQTFDGVNTPPPRP